MYNPKVTIVIPVYNGSDYVGEAIESALAQTYPYIEIIVINDGSTDGGKTEEVVLSYGDKIKYIKKENGGVSTALNAGINAAEGEWISWLSHDDLYTEDKIESQINDVKRFFETGSDYKKILYYCNGGYINAEGCRINKNSKGYESKLYAPNDILIEIFKGNFPGGCGFLLPKEMFLKIGGFDESLRYMQDVFMWEKAFISGYSFYPNNKVMSLTRIHPMQNSSTCKEQAIKDREKVGMYLSENLEGLKTQQGESILKRYMLLCMRNNSLNVGNHIFNKLKSQGELSLTDILRADTLKLYGKIRKRLVTVYYRLRFKTSR